jgi:hypothetical protein
VFDFCLGRGREGPKEFLGQFEGILQTDGYVAYEKVGGPRLVHAGCWAHSRRKFCDAVKLNPNDAVATRIVKLLDELFGIDAVAREESRAGPPSGLEAQGPWSSTLRARRRQTLANYRLCFGDSRARPRLVQRRRSTGVAGPESQSRLVQQRLDRQQSPIHRHGFGEIPESLATFGSLVRCPCELLRL